VDGWYTIDADNEACLLRLVMGGFFKQALIGRLAAEVRAAVSQMRCELNEHTTLCDIKAMKIQSQEMVLAFQQLVGSAAIKSRRLAFVTGSTLARLQAQRLTDRPDVAFFKDTEEAETWLRA
jgi:hypothetical protein